MRQPQIDNFTDFVVHPQLHYGREGEELLTVVKATFVLPRGGDRLEPAEPEQLRSVRPAAIPWGDPVTSAPKYNGDVCGRKPGTDVIVVAKAHAPNDEPTTHLDAVVRVGALQKALRVYGLRVWQEGGESLSAPRPFLEQEIRYDLAWGGLDQTDLEHIIEESRNPVGLGVVRDRATLAHQAAPCIEDPGHPIAAAGSVARPAGFGPIGPGWLPRRQFAGTYDEAWHRSQAPLQPADFDDRHNLCASPGLTATPPLIGSEELALYNLTPGGGAVECCLPGVGVVLTHQSPWRGPERVVPHLDTVVVDTVNVPHDATMIVELVWRSLTPAPRQLGEAIIAVDEQRVEAAA